MTLLPNSLRGRLFVLATLLYLAVCAVA